MTDDGELSTPVRPVSAAKAVAERLIAAIAVGDYSPGERLPPERDLAGMLEVSRVTVRAALAELREAGYVEIRRGRSGGSFVRRRADPRDAHRAEHLVDLRRLVESLIARTAAERHTPEDDAAITAALERYERAHDVATDVDLHRAIAAATHNPLLADLSRQLLTQVRLGDERPVGYSPEHRAMAEAVTAGKAEEAAALARRHFTVRGRVVPRQ